MKAKSIKSVIAEHFFIHPTEKLRVRQIERKLSMPLPSVIRYTKELESEGILKSSVLANVRFYSADRNSKQFLLEKKMFNIRSLYSTGLLDFLVKEFSNPPIIVFGSYSRGEDVEESDIDIFIQAMGKKVLELTHFEKALQRKIQLFVHKDIRDIKNKNLANNILNGIVINSFVEVFK